MSYFNLHGIESTNNSTTTPLASAATYTGTGEQNFFPQVGVMLKTDNAGTLFFDFSSDGTNWDSTFPVSGFDVAANVPEFHTAIKLGRYFRVRLVNDTGAQTFLRLTTYFGMNFAPSVAPLNQGIGTDSDAITVRPSIFSDEVLRGLRPGVSHFNKFGYRDGLTASGGEQTIWATSGNFTPLTTASTFTIAYTPASDGSTSTGALTLYFNYIDANGLLAEATHTLGSGGSDVTSFTGLGINRCSVASSGTNNANGADIAITATTGGTTQCFMPSDTSVSQQCIFFVDSNSYAIAKYLYMNVNKLSGGGNPRCTIKGYVFNRNVATRYEIFRHTIDTQSETTLVIKDPVGFRLTPGDVLEFVADTDTNSTNISARFSILEYKID